MTVEKGIRIHIGRIHLGRISFSKLFLYIGMLGLMTFTALPLIYVVSTAFKPLNEILQFPPKFFFRQPTLNNFSDLVVAIGSSSVPFTRYVFNSIFVTSAIVAGTVFVSSMGAYAMTKHSIPFGKTIYFTIIAALMFPPQVTQIPTYLVINGMNLVDTHFALIIPKIAVAYNLFLLKQFCEQLPDPLLEAARIDGAREWTVFTRIVFPFLRPAWATLVVFSFVSNWNDYFSPLVYLSKQAYSTLPLALTTISESGNLARAGAMAATTFLMTLPTILIFSFMQKKVIETMTHSGIK